MGFKRLEADDFVVSAQAQTNTCWTGNEPALEATSMFKNPPILISLDLIGSLIDLGTDPSAA